ncbi:putative MFS family arabinose efflux permease [Pseudoduganella lurida]|uniref:Putative MFS family arabinose efflux permease n=1 Tax=Pseudoduganella lurida TaxID=1036180 RepID=A0A562QXC7_9BURK|nr:MFS transporter [Pseudoduganella lurida]TWI60870.1 putative MFS family arabinose efflux permease [Pseudoduganella lurida]
MPSSPRASFITSIAERWRSDPLLASPDFRRYWTSMVLTSFGSQIGALALPLCAVLMLHATAAQMGILTAAAAIPYAFFALPAGVWLDRSRKLPILLGSKIAQGLSLASIPVAWWLDLLGMPWLYTVAAIQGTCSVIGGGAEQIFLTLLVGRERMVEAQSRFATTDSISRLLAPGLAGLLIQWLTAPVAIVVNAATFFISVWNMCRVKLQEAVPAPSDKHPLHDIREGFVFIWHQPLLRALAWTAGVWHLLFYGYSALTVLFATRELGMTAGMIGTAQMLGGIGVFVSSQLMRPLNRRYGPGVTILIGTAGTALGFVLMPTIPRDLFGSANATAAVYALLVFFFDCGVMLFFVPYLALRQKVTPDAMLGRMISTMRFLTVAVAPLGALLAGYVGDRFGVRTALYCIAAGGILLTAAMMASRPIRSVRPG